MLHCFVLLGYLFKNNAIFPISLALLAIVANPRIEIFCCLVVIVCQCPALPPSCELSKEELDLSNNSLQMCLNILTDTAFLYLT